MLGAFPVADARAALISDHRTVRPPGASDGRSARALAAPIDGLPAEVARMLATMPDGSPG